MLVSPVNQPDPLVCLPLLSGFAFNIWWGGEVTDQQTSLWTSHFSAQNIYLPANYTRKGSHFVDGRHRVSVCFSS